jgi:2-succinyl-5-enolpyruvyl-6-hydroxy-3-cyclohexene-1-carboxylate synthase
MEIYPKNKLAQLCVHLCLAYKIKHVVISPGSRNAPLIVGFFNAKNIKYYSIVDERSAGFFALGIAQQTKHPVVLVCTSGSALLNYYPAIAEAFYSKIPLIVLSADRPKYLIEIGDGQTVKQENVFKNHILESVNLYQEKTVIKTEQSNFKLISNTLELAINRQGPVHINVPFEEPLYETVNEKYKFLKINFEKQTLLNEKPLAVTELEKFANIWSNSSKKMVLIGVNNPSKLIQTQIDYLIKDESVLVLTENLSNIHHKNLINGIDKLIVNLNDKEFNELRPEILLTFGGMVVSKKIKQFLRNYNPKYHWHIDKDRAYDTFFVLNKHFKISSELFFSQFFFLTKNKKSNYQSNWISRKNSINIRHKNYLSKAIFSDLKAIDVVLNNLPKNINLQIANSSIIRYTQLFDLHKSINVFCNRGTSGIDGSTSTAIGSSIVCRNQTVFLTGDLSFLYDSNAFWNDHIPKNFRVILINNSGGGIFRILPGPKKTNALEMFETTHNYNAKERCKMFNINYFTSKNEKELEEILISFFKNSKKSQLLEIFTAREKNDLILSKYFDSL